MIGSSQPVMAMVGDDVILPCHIEPPVNMEKETVVWRRGSSYVHRLLDGRVDSEHQDPSYKQRTSLFDDQLFLGNISLKLSSVKLSDEGTYRCSVPILGNSSLIQLLVGKIYCSKHGWKNIINLYSMTFISHVRLDREVLTMVSSVPSRDKN